MAKLSDRADWRNMPLGAWGASRTTTERLPLSWPARRIQRRYGTSAAHAVAIAGLAFGGGTE